VTNPYTLGGWPPTDIVSPFRAAFPGAVVIAENDANAAAVGEWRIGTGRGTNRFVLVTLGTGVGVGFVVNGKIQRAVMAIMGRPASRRPSGRPADGAEVMVTSMSLEFLRCLKVRS